MNFAATDTADWSLYQNVNAVAIPFYGKLIISEGKIIVCT